jgi:hypothetical protein
MLQCGPRGPGYYCSLDSREHKVTNIQQCLCGKRKVEVMDRTSNPELVAEGRLDIDAIICKFIFDFIVARYK